MKQRYIQTVSETLHLEVGFTNDIGADVLTDAIIDALKRSSVLGLAGIVYIKASSPSEKLSGINLWAPVEVIPAEPPKKPNLSEVDPLRASALDPVPCPGCGATFCVCDQGVPGQRRPNL